jgi:DNA-binding NtrC family response regulator
MKVPKDLQSLFTIASRSESTVLLTGGTGTGKTSLARQIHDQSPRRNKAFVSINLATLHEGTLESELFGHEKGAFTGADQKRIGKFEFAQGGTVFLDEVGELPLRLQTRLLEFLQSKTISPVGSNRELKLDVRVIAATHRDLSVAVQKGQFREDLFHRLRVITIPLKSLRERSSEFDALVHQCLAEHCTNSGKSILRLAPCVAERLENYDWPGNIRELRNVLEYAVQSCDGEEITLKDLPLWMLQDEKNPGENRIEAVLGLLELPLTLDFQSNLEKFEKEFFKRALSRTGGRLNRTARQIGVNKTTLLRRLRAYGLETRHTS